MIKTKYCMEKSSGVQRLTKTEGVRTVCLSLALGLEKIKASARVSEGRLRQFQGRTLGWPFVQFTRERWSAQPKETDAEPKHMRSCDNSDHLQQRDPEQAALFL